AREPRASAVAARAGGSSLVPWAACRLLFAGSIMSKRRILVVDDEQNARAALRTILSEEGYEIAEAADGEEGLARLQEWEPDLVLADVRMPRMDGLSLLRKAKE